MPETVIALSVALLKSLQTEYALVLDLWTNIVGLLMWLSMLKMVDYF